MFVRVTKAVRLRSAGFLALLYLICVLAPAAAFAFADPARTAHCLTDKGVSAHVHGKNSGTHSHDHATADHSHDNDDGTAAADAQCCGLFCLSSLPATPVDVSPRGLPASLAVSSIAGGLAGNGPDTLYRPPDQLLSV